MITATPTLGRKLEEKHGKYTERKAYVPIQHIQDIYIQRLKDKIKP